MKLFVNMLSFICVLLNTKFHNTSENFYFEVIWSRTIVSCKVTDVTNRYMDFILDLDEEFNFQRPICLDSNRKHYYQSKLVDSMFAPGAETIQKWNFPLFWSQRDAGMGQLQIIKLDVQKDLRRIGSDVKTFQNCSFIFWEIRCVSNVFIDRKATFSGRKK